MTSEQSLEQGEEVGPANLLGKNMPSRGTDAKTLRQGPLLDVRRRGRRPGWQEQNEQGRVVGREVRDMSG